jgi:uncharacterized membrane protein YkvA (DUF1232 family)
MSDVRDEYEDDFDDGVSEPVDPRPPRRSRRSALGAGTTRRSVRGDVDEAMERPRTGAKRTVFKSIQQIPRYLKLLLGLMRDSRVSRLDRFLVVVAASYVVMPLDFVPDLIPFLGQVDDVFLVMTALQRLVERTDEDVLLDHWTGDPRELSNVNLARVVASAGFFLPSGIRRRLRRMARR